MAFLKVLNVQQGDCLTFRPNKFCKFENELFYVDLGNGLYDISKEIRTGDNIHLILTHSHRDHFNGILYLLPYANQIREVILPYCFNEIWLIAKAILNLKGMRMASSCEELKRELIDIDSIQCILRDCLQNQHIRFTFVYEGIPFCNHIEFLNPPLCSVSKNWLSEAEFHKVEEEINKLFEEQFAKKFLNYVQAQRQSHGNDHAFSREFLLNHVKDDYAQIIKMARAGCKMVLEFISNNYNIMSTFNCYPSKTNLNNIIKQYKITAHDACIVTRLFHEGESYLLSGDASKSVFYRLIQNGSIHADYFKIPHHGSSKNLDEKILQYISPKIAIISHGNAKFGQAKDTHPNQKILDLLTKKKIKILVTNDVVKNGKVVLKKTPYSTKDLEIE